MQQVWVKRWRNTGWLALAALTLVLLGAGVHKKNHKTCTGIEVKFDGDGNNFFIDQKGVAAVLKEEGDIVGLPIDKIDLKKLEGRLKQDKWIENAELFFDNKQVLQVLIEEKEPVARVFTANGTSFYIDSACRRLPLSEKLSARIPMFTNFPSDRPVLAKPDSELLASVRDLAVFIQSDELWKAQVAQVDITPNGFEMIPTLGNHVVALGKGGDYQQKFDRLFSFYKEVWTKVGFERYDRIDVQYNGQVVASVKGKRSSIVVDSAKAKAAFDSLLMKSKRATGDTANPAPADHADANHAANIVANNHAAATAAKDTAKQVKLRQLVRQTVAQNKPVVQKAADGNKKKVVPKAALKKAPVKKEAVSQSLTDEEEAIRKEALREQLKTEVKKKKAGKKVVKKKDEDDDE